MVAKPSCAITSQNDTAPKRNDFVTDKRDGAITSQNDTAPKRKIGQNGAYLGAITSQNDTAPKHELVFLVGLLVRLPVRTTLLQNNRLAAHA